MAQTLGNDGSKKIDGRQQKGFTVPGSDISGANSYFLTSILPPVTIGNSGKTQGFYMIILWINLDQEIIIQPMN